MATVRAQKRPPLKGLWCIVLAAGGSARLGRPKQLVRRRQRPLLTSAVLAAGAVAPGRVVVVLGARPLPLRLMLARGSVPVHVAYNARWREGMAGSLRAAITALPADAGAALVVLADQPLVDARALERLVRVWRARPRRAVAAAYGGRAGVPAILPRRLFRQAVRLRGDGGARALLAAEHNLARVPMPEAAVDVDTAEDLSKL